MGEKQCGKCGEMVDEAKAFCPGCGASFVEEKKRTSVSDFDLSEHTVRLGDSMYNKMLSEMGLSISKQPNRDEKKEESITPVVSPNSAGSPERTAEPSPAAHTRRRSIVIGIAVIVIALVLLAAIVIVAAAVRYFG